MDDSRYQVKVVGQENIFEISSTEHILDSLAKKGLVLAPKGACHGGGCGVCKIKILKGDIKTISMSKKYITDEEKELGYSLACRTFANSDLEFEFIGKPQCKRVTETKKYGFV